MAMSDTTKSILLANLFGIPGQIIGAVGDSKAAAANQANQEAYARAALLRTWTDYQDRGPGGTASMGAALGALGSPLSTAKERGDFALRRSFLFDGPGGAPQYVTPKQGYMQSYMPNMPRFDSAKPFFSDEAMLSSEMPYWQAMSGLTGGKVAPGFQAAGYKSQPASMAQYALNQSLYRDAYEKAMKDAQFQQLFDQERQALMQSLQPQQQKKTPWWKKVLGVAGMVGSMFIPGLQGVGPVAMGLLRAGAGAASGALMGGTKGALLGGALGGFSSLPIKGIQNIPGIGSAPGAKGMTGLKNLFTGNFLGHTVKPGVEGPPISAMGGGMIGAPQGGVTNNPWAMGLTGGGIEGQVNNALMQRLGLPGYGVLDYYLGNTPGLSGYPMGPRKSLQRGYAQPNLFGLPWQQSIPAWYTQIGVR